MSKKRGIPCIVIGIVVAALGFFPIIAGIIIDNSDSLYEYQTDNYYNYELLLNLPKILLIAGAVIIFIGLMLVILGVILYSASDGKNPVPAPAASSAGYNPNDTNYNNPAPQVNEAAKDGTANQCAIIDEVNYLTEYQKIGLLSRLSNFKSKTNYGIAIFIKHDDFNEQLYKSAYNFYKTKVLGQSCVILVISAANSNMFISTMGDCRNHISDQTKERVYDKLRGFLSVGQYYDACIEFIDSSLDSVTGANNYSASPQFSDNAVTPEPVSGNKSEQQIDVENINPYAQEDEPQVFDNPVQPAETINSNPYNPSQPENIAAHPDTVAQNSVEELSTVDADVQPVAQNNFCQMCGAPIEQNSNFCTQCGNKIN